MTLRINHNSGKGSNRRATQDDNAYLNNYDVIFNKNKAPDTETKSIVTDKATWKIKQKIIPKKPSFVSINDAPPVLNMQDKVMWVVGYNEAIKAYKEYYESLSNDIS